MAPAAPLCQGDIFRFEWPEGQSGPKLGVIVNADCDLAHGKIDGVVAFAPIYSFGDYLADFWAPGHISGVAEVAANAALKIVGDADGDALRAWLTQAGVDAVADAFAASAKLRPGLALQLRQELQKLAVCLDEDQAPMVRFKALCALSQNPVKYARTQLNAAKTAMGEGHFFVSDLVDHSSLGFVVRLRRVYVLAVEDVFTASSEQRSRSDGRRPTAVRIARLTPLYRFRVLQLFAQQYSRVGLPDELSALSDLVVEDLVVTYSGVS